MMHLALPSTTAPLSILCLGAHCDDIEIGCGATLLELVKTRELSVTWAIFAADATREAETRDCARALLGDRCRFIVARHRDGFLPYRGEAVKDDFERLKTQVEPDLVFTHTRHDLHQDHRLVCELTWNTFRNHLILEYEIPKFDGDIGNPNVYAPITEEAASAKIGALLASYPSQRGKPWFDPDLFRSLMRLRGMECNSPTRLAEAFYCRKATLTA